MRTIKVFLASSEELGQERLEIGDLFSHINTIFNRRGIHLEVSKWEYLDESMGPLRKQDEYNREIKTCDICMVLYWTRIGEYTNEELETAYTELQAGRKPYKIYLYFKEVGVPTPEIEAFKKELYSKYSHFYGKFQNIDTLKLRFLLQLESYVNSGAVKVENSQVMVDTVAVAHLDNVPFAAQNSHYKELKERLAKIEEEIKAFEAVLAVQANDTIQSLLNAKKSEHYKIQEELASHEQSLFDTAVRVAKFAGEKISERMRRAIALFEEGKVTEANTLLDDAERDADASLAKYKQTKELLAAERDTVIHSIEELTLKASVMLADNTIAAADRVERAAAIYAKATDLARECDYDKEKFATLLEKQSNFLCDHARYSEAQVVNNEWLALCIRYLGEKHVSTATSYNNIGAVYKNLGDYDKALDYYNKSLSICLEVFGDNHPYVATRYNNIGAVYYNLGDYDNALDYYNKSLSIRLEVFGDNHPYVAQSYNNIGLVYANLGDYEKALDYFNKSLSICLEVFGGHHPDVALSYNNIGFVYDSLGDYDNALDYYNKSLSIRLEVFGDNHPYVAQSYNNIGLVYANLGDYEKALDYFNKSLSICLEVFGGHHPDVALSYNNIGFVYDSLGDYDNALDYYNKSLSIYLEVFGGHHPNVAQSYNNIGVVYRNLGDYDNALDYFNKSLSIRLEVFGNSHPNVATSYNNIGVVYYNLGDYDNALDYFNKSLSIRLEVFGDSHPDIASSYNNIGFVYANIGDHAQALEYYKKALAGYVAVYGETSNDALSAIIDVANMCFELGDDDKAVSYIKQGAAAGSEWCIEWLRENGVE